MHRRVGQTPIVTDVHSLEIMRDLEQTVQYLMAKHVYNSNNPGAALAILANQFLAQAQDLHMAAWAHNPEYVAEVFEAVGTNVKQRLGHVPVN